jgi:hypothetical protein
MGFTGFSGPCNIIIISHTVTKSLTDLYFILCVLSLWLCYWARILPVALDLYEVTHSCYTIAWRCPWTRETNNVRLQCNGFTSVFAYSASLRMPNRRQWHCYRSWACLLDEARAGEQSRVSVFFSQALLKSLEVCICKLTEGYKMFTQPKVCIGISRRIAERYCWLGASDS